MTNLNQDLTADSSRTDRLEFLRHSAANCFCTGHAWFVATALSLWPLQVTPQTNPPPSTTLPRTGTVEGVITFAGTIPKSPIPDDAGIRRDLVEVDATSRGLRYVVVELASVDRATNAAGSAAPAGVPQVTVDQQDHAFVPRVVAVRPGESVLFTNSDPANHNVRTTARAGRNVFNVFTGIDGKYVHRFVREPNLRPVRLGCDIHPWMRGWVYVFDHPWYAVTDSKGKFRVEGIPAGEYQARLQQPDLGYQHERRITVAPGQTVRLEAEVRADRPTPNP